MLRVLALIFVLMSGVLVLSGVEKRALKSQNDALTAENAELRATIEAMQPTVTPERSYFANEDGSCPGWIKTEELTVWLDSNRTRSFGTVKRGQQVNILAWKTGPAGMLNVNIPGGEENVWIEYHGYVDFAYPCPSQEEVSIETPVPVTSQQTAEICVGWIGASEEKLWADEQQIDLLTVLKPGEEISVIGRTQDDMIFVIYTHFDGQRYYGWLGSRAEITVESPCDVPGFPKE